MKEVPNSFSLLQKDQKNVSIESFNDFVSKIKFNYSVSYKITFYIILIVEDGEGVYAIDFTQTSIKPGDILLLSPGQVFTCNEKSSIKGKVIYFDEDFFNMYCDQEFFKGNFDLMQSLSNQLKINIGVESNVNLHHLLTLFELECSRNLNDLNTVTILQHLLSSLLYLIDRENSNTRVRDVIRPESKLAIQFKLAIQREISIKNNVEYFIDKLNTTKSALLKSTKITFEKTPKHMIEDVILLEAKRLLKVSDLRVQEISYQLGFTDPTNFTKFFKKNYGDTPENFRKKNHL